MDHTLVSGSFPRFFERGCVNFSSVRLQRRIVVGYVDLTTVVGPATGDRRGETCASVLKQNKKNLVSCHG